MKIRSAIGVLLLVAVAGGCSFLSPTPTTDPSAAFCDSLRGVAVAVADYHRLGPDDSIEAYKAAAQDVQDAVQVAIDARTDLAAAEVDALASVVTSLKAYVEELPQDVPVAEVQDQIQAQVRAVAAARLSIGIAACGEPAPASFAPLPEPSA